MTKRVILSLALAVAMTSAFAGVAKADPWHDHEVRAYHHWHGPHYVPAPRVVYAPPVVYSPPPPPPSAGINLILPLHFN